MDKELRLVVHPVVPLTILDLYARDVASEKAGALLGLLHLNRIQITTAIIVPQVQGDSLKLDMQFYKSSVQQHKKSSSNEVVVGAFVTQTNQKQLQEELLYLTTQFSNQKNLFMKNEILTKPIVLSIDPTMRRGHFNMQAFCFENPFSFDNKFRISAFQRLPIELNFTLQGPEHIIPSLNFFGSYKGFANLTDLTSQLVDNLAVLREQVRKIKEGKKPVAQELLLAVERSLVESGQQRMSRGEMRVLDSVARCGVELAKGQSMQ